ncbi:hypothetical protein HPP92_008012 [Vanilla planifolia]|uniref:Prolamin-like domain-containing protein n=1 Tax=Vanilla planifolia TaxID=51239 RepID=A0A835RH32_VANPL|nr:hypothetical protein HPP92_008012 [Vanilla planifolia]
MEKKIFAAMVLLSVVLGAMKTLADMPINPYVPLPKNPFGDKFARMPDPPPKVIIGPGPPEPTDTLTKVYNRLGLPRKPMAIGYVKAFFINGTLPPPEICEGVMKVHPHCFPDMFNVWYFVNPFRINHLHNHCSKTVRNMLALSRRQRQPPAA